MRVGALAHGVQCPSAARAGAALPTPSSSTSRRTSTPSDDEGDPEVVGLGVLAHVADRLLGDPQQLGLGARGQRRAATRRGTRWTRRSRVVADLADVLGERAGQPSVGRRRGGGRRSRSGAPTTTRLISARRASASVARLGSCADRRDLVDEVAERRRSPGRRRRASRERSGCAPRPWRARARRRRGRRCRGARRTRRRPACARSSSSSRPARDSDAGRSSPSMLAARRAAGRQPSPGVRSTVGGRSARASRAGRHVAVSSQRTQSRRGPERRRPRIGRAGRRCAWRASSSVASDGAVEAQRARLARSCSWPSAGAPRRTAPGAASRSRIDRESASWRAARRPARSASQGRRRRAGSGVARRVGRDGSTPTREPRETRVTLSVVDQAVADAGDDGRDGEVDEQLGVDRRRRRAAPPTATASADGIPVRAAGRASSTPGATLTAGDERERHQDRTRDSTQRAGAEDAARWPARARTPGPRS